jgi:hypothetical protein
MFVSHMVRLCTSHLKMFEVFAVRDSRAREVVLNSLRQPGVDFVPWVTRTRKAYKLWATSKGPEWFNRLGSVLRKKCYTQWCSVSWPAVGSRTMGGVEGVSGMASSWCSGMGGREGVISLP